MNCLVIFTDTQLALRQNATQLSHEHFMGGILEVQARKAKEHHVSSFIPLRWCGLTGSTSPRWPRARCSRRGSSIGYQRIVQLGMEVHVWPFGSRRSRCIMYLL